MCGIFGFAGNKPANPMKIRVLALENQSRGRDSTGIYGRRLYRSTKMAADFVKDCNFDHIASANVVVGHTRNSTGGAITKFNAHPFVWCMGGQDEEPKTLVGTHNGWIVNEHEAEQTIKGFKRADVDSDSIFKAMAMSNDIFKFQMFEGPMALAFIYDGDLHLYRRSSRPLHYARSKRDGGYYYSSEVYPLTKIGFEKDEITELPENTLIRIKNGSIDWKFKIPEPRVKFHSSTTSYSWKNSVKDELVEELTGEKKLVPVATATGDTQKDTAMSTSTNREIVPYEIKGVKGAQAVFGRNMLIPSQKDIADKQVQDTVWGLIKQKEKDRDTPNIKISDINELMLPLVANSWLANASRAVEIDAYGINVTPNERTNSAYKASSLNVRLKSFNRTNGFLTSISADRFKMFMTLDTAGGETIIGTALPYSTEYSFNITELLLEGRNYVTVNLTVVDMTKPGVIHTLRKISVKAGTSPRIFMMIDFEASSYLESSIQLASLQDSLKRFTNEDSMTSHEFDDIVRFRQDNNHFCSRIYGRQEFHYPLTDFYDVSTRSYSWSGIANYKKYSNQALIEQQLKKKKVQKEEGTVQKKATDILPWEEPGTVQSKVAKMTQKDLITSDDSTQCMGGEDTITSSRIDTLNFLLTTAEEKSTLISRALNRKATQALEDIQNGNLADAVIKLTEIQSWSAQYNKAVGQRVNTSRQLLQQIRQE